MSDVYQRYQWSYAVKFLFLFLNTVLVTAMLYSGAMMNEAQEAGKSTEAFFYGLMCILAIPGAIVAFCTTLWVLLGLEPSPEASPWARREVKQ